MQLVLIGHNIGTVYCGYLLALDKNIGLRFEIPTSHLLSNILSNIHWKVEYLTQIFKIYCGDE